ncbi:hypothetical protein [Cytobacillus oceanisediminis]|nr:hypothetical protein [Cytobacillus oceanisediminis]
MQALIEDTQVLVSQSEDRLKKIQELKQKELRLLEEMKELLKER